jgi:hypothetical protein
MRRLIYFILTIFGILGIYSCAEEISDLQQEGNPSLQVENQFTNVHFGDVLPFTATVSDNIPLSTLTAILYFGEEEVERTTIRTKENGVYSGEITVPFLKDIPDGTATLEFVLLNTTLKSVIQTFDIPITRASYPYLILVTADGSYPMIPTGVPNEYAATEPFPSTELPAYIKTPVVDDKGQEIIFGWEAGAVTQGVSENIPFVSPTGGTYSVTFNTPEKIEYMLELRNSGEDIVAPYADEFPSAKFYPGKKPWECKVDIALPCAIQNELNLEDAKQLKSNGVILVAEVSNMGCTSEAVDFFTENEMLFAPGKAVNAGGVACSGLEMTQNAMHLSWDNDEVDRWLRQIMNNIHQQCATYGKEGDYINYVKGANIAGFMKVADAMMAQGVV